MEAGARPNRIGTGILFMILACALFSSMAAFGRDATERFSFMEVTFFRCFLAVVPVVAIGLGSSGFASLRVKNWWLLIGLVMMKRHRRLGITVASTGLAALYALSTPVVGGALISSLEAVQPISPGPHEPGAIIVAAEVIDVAEMTWVIASSVRVETGAPRETRSRSAAISSADW